MNERLADFDAEEVPVWSNGGEVVQELPASAADVEVEGPVWVLKDFAPVGRGDWGLVFDGEGIDVLANAADNGQGSGSWFRISVFSIPRLALR